MTERARILIVEDEQIVSEDLKEVLERNGYTVSGNVASGRAAIEAVRTGKPDLILMDINLNGDIDGIETTTRIHEDSDIPVIYLTSYTSEGYIENAKKTDPYGYITKPFDPQTVITTIEIALNKHAIDIRTRANLDTYRFIAEYSASWEMWLDANGTPVYISPSCERITGYKPEDIIANPRLLQDMVFLEDRHLFLDEVEGATCPRDAVHFRIITHSGDVRWISQTCVQIQNKQGAVVGKRISNVDITHEQEQIQDFALALRESNERYLLLSEAMADTVIFVYDETHGLEYINTRGASLIGKKPQDLLNKKIPDLFSPQNAKYAGTVLEDFLAKGNPSFIENTFSRFPGDELSLEIWLFPLDRQGQDARKIWGLMHDVSDKKRAEKKILQALREKDVLLKEIHHRVKNNLQQVASLLYLQETRGNTTDSLTALHESRDRIFSMALVHEILIASDTLSRINLASYLSQLVEHIKISYGRESTSVTVNMQIDPALTLSLDECVPCGLIINELVSNSMKHAFQPGVPGEIFIHVSGDEQTCTLVVGDNGCGLPPSADSARAGTLGLQLVTQLVRQLEGSLNVSGEHGTKFTIRFPVKRAEGSDPP
jgi:PAS domain S-box-containing protein